MTQEATGIVCTSRKFFMIHVNAAYVTKFFHYGTACRKMLLQLDLKIA